MRGEWERLGGREGVVERGKGGGRVGEGGGQGGLKFNVYVLFPNKEMYILYTFYPFLPLVFRTSMSRHSFFLG